MKKTDLINIKSASIGEISSKIATLKKEIASLSLEKNNKSSGAKGEKDTKTVYKKRKDIAQMLTILRQKQILEQLELQVKEKK